MEPDPDVEEALRAERRFVLALGGYALEIAGGTLLTHEKIPSPRFNFVSVTGVAPDRQTAFFERALDHYFQRALRPRFRVIGPVPAHVDRTLRRFSFEPCERETELLLATGPRPPAADGAQDVRPATAGETDLVASFWSEPSERPELRMALDVARHHPPPGESLVPLLAWEGSRAISAALVYRAGRAAGVHFVTTRPEDRGRGGASALVAAAQRLFPAGEKTRCSLFTNVPRIARHLGTLGFAPAASFVEYELPPSAELALPPPGPPTPPRWRPPR